MAGIVRHMIPPLLLLLCCSVIVKCREYCLTWNIHQDKLNFTCRVPGFLHPISLIDSQGQLYTYCIFDRGTHTCTPLVRKDFFVKAHFAYNVIIFTIPKLNKNMDGLWVCEQNNLRLPTRVSLSRGIIDSTEVSIAGQFHNENHNPEAKLTCFSCREPDGNNVEFLENSRSVDSLTFVHNTGKCIHHKGECHPDECACTGIEYILTFQYNDKNNGATYSCDMLFTDPFTNEKFSKLASLNFNGKEFDIMNTSTAIQKAGDKFWNGTVTLDMDNDSIAGVDPSRIVPVAVTENISVESTGGLKTFQMIAIVVGCVAVFMFVLILVRQRKNQTACRKKKKTESIGIVVNRETERFISTTSSSSSTDTDKTSDKCTMTESSHVVQDKTSDKCTMTESSHVVQESADSRSNGNDCQGITVGSQNIANLISDGNIFLLTMMNQIVNCLHCLQSDINMMKNQMRNTKPKFIDTCSFKLELYALLKNKFLKSPWLNVPQDIEFMNEVNNLLAAEGYQDDTAAYRNVILWCLLKFKEFRTAQSQKINQEMKNQDLSSVTIDEFCRCIMFDQNIDEESTQSTDRRNLCLLLRCYIFDVLKIAVDKNKLELPQEFWEGFKTYYDEFMGRKEIGKWRTLTISDSSRETKTLHSMQE